MTVKSYDPKKVSLVTGGISVYGFGPDTKITISRNNMVSTITEGVDGDISVNIDNRYSGKMEIQLLHNSSMNAIYENWLKQVEVTGNPFFPVTFSDPSGSSLSTIGWLEEQPSYDVGTETSTRTWVIGLQDARMYPNATIATVSGVQSMQEAQF